WETLMFTLPERERGASITESCDGMGPVAGKVPNEPAGNVTRIGVSVVPARPWNSRLGKRRALAAPIFCSARSTDRAALATLRFWRKARATASSRVSTSGPAPTVSADAVALTANARTVQNDIARIAFPFPRPEVAARHPFPRRVPTAACDDNSPRMLDLPVRTREDGLPTRRGPRWLWNATPGGNTTGGMATGARMRRYAAPPGTRGGSPSDGVVLRRPRHRRFARAEGGLGPRRGGVPRDRALRRDGRVAVAAGRRRARRGRNQRLRRGPARGGGVHALRLFAEALARRRRLPADHRRRAQGSGSGLRR